MVSPNLSKKQANSLQINDNVKKLMQVVYSEQNKKELSEDIPRIKVSELISKMSFYYEKIRNTVDYNEEYLLRKNAIHRILRRQIYIEGVIKVSRSDELAKHLLIELIRAGYLPNNKIPESKITEIGNIIEKYLKLRNYSLARIKPTSYFKTGNVVKAKDEIRERNNLINWLLAIASTEIEERLEKDKIKETVASNMYDFLVENIKLPTDSEFKKEDLKIQIYIAIYRVYMKFDEEMISYILFKYYNRKWSKANDEEIALIARHILPLRQNIEKQLNHPLKKQLINIVKKYNVYFSIQSDLISEDPVKIFNIIKNDPKAFPRLIKQNCSKKYSEIKSKLWRVALRSIIYIFITKSFFAFILEVPITKWFGEEVDLVSLVINISFPALLLFAIVLFTKLPGDENTEQIIKGIEEITFEEKKRTEPILLRKPLREKKIMHAIFGILYTIMFFISFGAVVYVLDRFLYFNWVSIIIFLFFLALISFFGIKVKDKANELTVIEKKERILSLIGDFFYTPIIAVGKWLSEKFSRINVLAFFLDFIIEAPFKVFVEIAEEWTKYVKERREDIN